MFLSLLIYMDISNQDEREPLGLKFVDARFFETIVMLVHDVDLESDSEDSNMTRLTLPSASSLFRFEAFVMCPLVFRLSLFARSGCKPRAIICQCLSPFAVVSRWLGVSWCRIWLVSEYKAYRCTDRNKAIYSFRIPMSTSSKSDSWKFLSTMPPYLTAKFQ